MMNSGGNRCVEKRSRARMARMARRWQNQGKTNAVEQVWQDNGKTNAVKIVALAVKLVACQNQ